jgi:FixJ family two-component response regulator
VTSPACIAVVDDEAPVRTMLGRILRLDGFDVALYPSGDAFLDSLATRTPACVILDVHMPGLSGFEVQSRLRSSGAGIPAIFITASDDLALDRTAADAGGVALLRKPFTSKDLLAAVGDALARAPPRSS